MTYENLLDHLFYSSYAANRGYGMTQEQLEKLFGKDLSQYEEQYQKGCTPKTLNVDVAELNNL